MIWLILASLLILTAAWLVRRYASSRAATLGLAGELVYSDEEDRGELLVSETHGLVGRPDYIRRESGELIPVERKSRQVTSAGPYDGEILQLAAYCLLVEERFGVTVRYGQLQYANRSVDIEFDPGLRAKLLSTIESIAAAMARNEDVARSHNQAARCRACGFRKSCDQSLADA